MIRTPSSLRNPIESNLILISLLLLLIAFYQVLRIFFGVFTFTLIFYVSFFKNFEDFILILNGRRKLAGVLYSTILFIIMAIPFLLMVTAIGKHIKDFEHYLTMLHINGLPPLPLNITQIPYLGQVIADFWSQLQQNPKEIVIGHEHQIKNGLHYLLTGGLGIVGTCLQVLLGIIISAFFLVGGKKKLIPLRSALGYLLGKKEAVLLLEAIGNAIKGVSVGVIGTAFLGAIFSWIGFAMAGLHFKFLFSALIFLLILIQVGPLLVWLPLIIWKGLEGEVGITIFLIIYAICMWVAESILRPYLISKSGGKLPFMVLFVGVIGGLAAWGFTGMFKGAIITAVIYTVFKSWLETKENKHPAKKLYNEL